MRQRYNMKVSKAAFLSRLPRNMACVSKETGLLRLSVKLSSVTCCFKVLIHEMGCIEHSHRMTKREGFLESIWTFIMNAVTLKVR